MTTIPAHEPRLQRRVILASAALATAALVALYAVAVCTARGQWWDEAIWWRVRMRSPYAPWETARALGVITPVTCAAALAGVVLLALAGGRARQAVLGTVCAAGTFATAEGLKLLLVRPDLGVSDWWGNSFPSGHSGAVAAVAVAAIVALGRGSRLVVASLACLATLATGCGVVVAGWHRPSDPVASTLVAVIWTLVGLLLVRHETMRS